MLANSISNADELAVQEELEALEREELAKKIPTMPDVPTTIKDTPEHERPNKVVNDEEPVQQEERQAILA